MQCVRSPTQLPSHQQWWSMRRTQRQQSWQCFVRARSSAWQWTQYAWSRSASWNSSIGLARRAAVFAAVSAYPGSRKLAAAYSSAVSVMTAE